MNDTRTCDQAGLLRFLFDKFDAKAATDDELEYLSSAIDVSSTAARMASDQLSDIALNMCTGNVTERESQQVNGVALHVALSSLSDLMRMVGELTFIGSEAAFEERRRAEANRKPPRVERNKHSERGGT